MKKIMGAELKRRLVSLASLPDVGYRDLFACVLDEARTVFGAASGALLLFDPAEQEPVLIASDSFPRRDGSRPVPSDISATTLRRLGRLSGPRHLDACEVREVFATAAERQPAAMCIPLLERRRTIGVLCLGGAQWDLLAERQLERLEALLEAALPALYRVILRERFKEAGAPTGIIGVGEIFLQLEARLRTIGWLSQGSVLITGEPGSGKELAAWAIHLWSQRRRRPLIPVLVSAMSEELFTAELFGHERHAFTGAVTERAGKFLAADGGTILLDEAGDIPLPVQAALLRVLENGELSRLGSDRPIRADARVLAATNRDLPGLVREKRFRSDLYDRLRLFEIRVPPLRERREDIPCLVRHFMTRHCAGSWRLSVFEKDGLCRDCLSGRSLPCVTSGFLEVLQSYDWPGNVRQLKNLIVQLTALYPDEILDERHLPDEFRRSAERRTDALATLDEAIRSYIEATLQVAGFNQSQAARLLDLPLSTLRSKMKRLGIPAMSPTEQLAKYRKPAAYRNPSGREA